MRAEILSKHLQKCQPGVGTGEGGDGGALKYSLNTSEMPARCG